MTYNITLYTILYGITALITFVTTVIAYLKGKNRLVNPLVILMAAITWWTLCGAFESAATEVSWKVYWSKLEYIGNLAVPVLFFIFAIRLSQREFKLTQGRLMLLFIIPVVTILLTFTNELHRLIWTYYSSVDPITNLMEYHYGFWIWIGTVGYAYILLVIGTVIIVRSMIRYPTRYKGHMIAVLVALILPWVGSILYTFKINPFPGFDLTRIAFALSGIILLIAVFNFRLLDLSPIVRSQVFDNMSDGIMVIDSNRYIVDLNPAASRILNRPLPYFLGSHISVVLNGNPELSKEISRLVDSPGDAATCIIGKYFLEVTASVISDEQHVKHGTIILLHDVTSIKKTESELLQRDRLLQATSNAVALLLATENLDEAINGALRILGEALLVDRVYIFENLMDPATGDLLTSQRHEWSAAHITSEQDNPLLQNISYKQYCPSWPAILSSGQSVKGLVRELSSGEREVLEPQGIKAILVSPVFISDHLWGSIGFDDCTTERIWSTVEEQLLQTAAITLGTAYVRKRTEIELLREKEKAEASDRLKSTFLATMSHELRTPMNAIIGFSEFSTEQTPMEDLYNYMKIIHSSGKQLLAIIEDLFNISLIEAGEVTIHPETFEIHRISTSIERVFKSEQKLLKKEHVLFYFNMDETLAHTVLHTDPNRLLQILYNLVRNAIKFTEQGFVEFSISRHSQKALAFSVKDTGIGISEEKHNIIFEKFRQVDDSHTRKYGGTGLGLAIAKQLSELMGGSLTVESSPGEGARFTLILNCLEINSPLLRNKSASSVNAGFLLGRTILLAEDEESNYQLIKAYFAQTHCSLLWVTNGREAIEMVRLRPEIDLVLMDLKMPHLDGYNATPAIKVIRSSLPVIAMTAHAMFGDQERVIQAGFNDYLAKPVSRIQLFRMLEKYLNQ